GAAYITGSAGSSDFPITPGAFQPTLNGYSDVFVTKLNPTGTALAYSTYLGGSVYDNGTAIALDSTGAAYVTGNTASTNFPMTSGSFQTSLVGTQNTFIAKLNPTGT